MKQNFTKNELSILFRRGNDNEIRMSICSDYSKSNHKGCLYIKEDMFTKNILEFWRSIKTTKLRKLDISFGEIDHYDSFHLITGYYSMVDIYEVPSFYIERGLRKVRVEYNEHGSIPKDWSFNLNATFSETKVITPILEVVKAALGSFFTITHEKEFSKVIREFLQGKEAYATYNFERPDSHR